MKIIKKIIVLSLGFLSSCGAVPTPVNSFFGVTVQNAQSLLRAQPNSNGGVGPEQYVLITNDQIRSFNKATGKPDGILDMDTASFLGFPTADTHILYDRWSKRWIACGDVVNYYGGYVYDFPTIGIAYSDAPVITKNTKWKRYTFPNQVIIPPATTASYPGGNSGVDSPLIATDQNAFYLTVSIFGFDAATSNYPLIGVTLVVMPLSAFDKESIEGRYTVFPGVVAGGNPGLTQQTPAANNFDRDPKYGYIINAQSPWVPQTPAPELNALYLFRIANSGGCNPNLGPQVTIPVPTYVPSLLAPHAGNRWGAFGTMQTTGCGFDTGGTHIRNKQLFVVQSSTVDITGTGTNIGDRVAVFWYQFDLTGDPTGRGNGTETINTIPALVQRGVIYDNAPTNPKFYYIPSIMTNKKGDIVITGNVSGAEDYINVFYALGKAGTNGGATTVPALLTHETLPYNMGALSFNAYPLPPSSGQRWGDYSSLFPDPCNDLDLWSTNEAVALPNGWGVLATKFVS